VTAKFTAKNGTSGNDLRCLVMIDQLPGNQLATVRKPPGGFRGWIARMEEKLTRKVLPDTQVSSHIRGNRVATDYLIQALLEHSHRAQFSLVVEGSRRGEFEQWAANWLQKDGLRPVEIHTAPELFGHGLDTIAPNIWLDLSGLGDSGLRMRDLFSSRVFPVVSLQHGISHHTLLYGLFLRIMLTPSYACDSLICTSKACQKAVANILAAVSASFNDQFSAKISFEGRLDLIPLCVDTDALRPRDKLSLRKQLGISKDAVVLLYVGYLSSVKADLTPLLPMMRRLVDENPRVNLQFMIAGTGPESYGKSLLTTVQELNLGKSVTVLREVSDTFKEQLFGAADIFVAPCESMNESFGLTVVEAMSCGLPQVVADWDGYRDTVAHGETGFLISTCWGRCDGDFCCTGDIFGWVYDHTLLSQSVSLDVRCMQEHLQALICNPELRATMSERSRDRAVAEFSHASVARRYDELWAELTAIADKLQPYAKARRFDQPAYFNFLGHFASKELTDDCVVRAAANNCLPISKLIHNVQGGFSGIPVLDKALLDRLIQIVSTAESASEGKSVRELISQTANETRSSDTIRRHILFLLKHGKLGFQSRNRS